MFKTLNQKEMMNVNGGFKYIPYYEQKVYYLHGYVYGRDPKKFIKLVQVSSDDSRTQIVKEIKVVLG